MTSKEYLFYGLGMVAHAVAAADGTIQAQERSELHELIQLWAEKLDEDYEVTEIIFQVLKDDTSAYENGYDQGMKNIRLGDQYLTESMKEHFLFLIQDVARAFPPITTGEKSIIDRFEKDLSLL